MYAASTSLAERHIMARAAHELRNTLAPLSDAVELLLLTGDPQRRARAADMAKRQLRCMRQIVSEMTEAGTCAQPSDQMSSEPLVLQEVVRDGVAAAASMFAARAQHSSCYLDSDPLWVQADPVRLTQVLSNLLTNASKYTACGGHISVSCTKADATTAEIAVVDDGAGIATENLPRVFDLFYREDRAKQLAPGCGVGLNVVSTLVQAHGGTVRVESDGAGTGARFVVRLPLLAASSAAS